MDKKEAKTVLNEKLGNYRELSYQELVAKIGKNDCFQETGTSGTKYQVCITVVWDDKPGGDVHVLGSIDDGGIRSFFPIGGNDFIVAPDGTFVDED